MTAQKSNEVLEEQIKQLRIELNTHKADTRENFKDVQRELQELERSVDSAQKVADQVNTSMRYVTQAVDEMKTLVSGFTNLIREHNSKIDDKMNTQNAKIDDFINSDKRQDSKKQFVVSVLQVVAGIIATVLGFWATGKI